jgi:predicted nucleic acid-binding Zn ribbon protein
MAKKTLQPIDRLGDVLGNSLKRLELSSRLDEYGVWPIWNDVVGKTIAVNAQPEKIRNGTLFVKVTSPVWMQQLQFMKQMIAEKLNQRLKREIVKNIFFVVGRIDSPSPPETATAVPLAAMDQEPKVDQQFLETVTDPEIRQAFKRLLKSYSRRQRRQD